MIEDNIFMTDKKSATLEDYLRSSVGARRNLGPDIPVFVYRLLEYSLKEELSSRLGHDEQTRLFRGAGARAGEYFAHSFLDLQLPLSGFAAQLSDKFRENRIGILRMESADEATGCIVLTVSEDADCSGLPVLGEAVCNYDEGFISGILSIYTGKKYNAVEIDCWGTGDRVCRFRAEPESEDK